MKKILPVCLLLFLVILIKPGFSYAQNESVGFELYPPQEPDKDHPQGIDDTTERVTVTFTGIEGDNLKICYRADYCIKNPAVRMYKDTEKMQDLLEAGLDNEDVKDLQKFEGNTVTVCAASESTLKPEKDCKDSKDYFHAGHFYILNVFEEQGGKLFVKGRAGFYVNHRMPKFEVKPRNPSAPQLFDTVITLDKLSKDGRKNSNNFQLVIEGKGIEEQYCTSDLKVGEPYSLTFPTSEWFDNKNNWLDGTKKPMGLVAGKYIIKLNERINDSNTKLRNDNCQGGFTYWQAVCQVKSKKDTNQVNQEKELTECEMIEDPNQSDTNKLFEFLASFSKVGDGIPLPCKKAYNVTNPLDCNEIDTAIGPITLTPVGFLTRIFSLILSIAAVGAVILIIYSGYRMLLSRGNKEAIQGARETLTAAIIGLLFIVFSLVILSFITGSILKIPGFG